MDVCKRNAGRPTREEAARIDDRVLEGARASFCARGIDGASMDEIAQATGVTKQAIYRRYDSKSALLDAVVARDLARLRGVVTPTGEADAMAALQQAARGLFDFGIEPENVGFFAFLSAEAAFSDELRARFAAWCDQVMAPLIALVADAQGAGDLRQGCARSAAYLLCDLLDGASKRMQLGLDDAFVGACAASHFDERWRVFRMAWAC